MSDPRFNDPLYNSGYVDGASDEQERIIELLEEAQKSQPCQCDDCGDHVWDKAIALIKGEQK